MMGRDAAAYQWIDFDQDSAVASLNEPDHKSWLEHRQVWFHQPATLIAMGLHVFSSVRVTR